MGYGAERGLSVQAVLGFIPLNLPLRNPSASSSSSLCSAVPGGLTPVLAARVPSRKGAGDTVPTKNRWLHPSCIPVVPKCGTIRAGRPPKQG